MGHKNSKNKNKNENINKIKTKRIMDDFEIINNDYHKTNLENNNLIKKGTFPNNKINNNNIIINNNYIEDFDSENENNNKISKKDFNNKYNKKTENKSYNEDEGPEHMHFSIVKLIQYNKNKMMKIMN